MGGSSSKKNPKVLEDLPESESYPSEPALDENGHPITSPTRTIRLSEFRKHHTHLKTYNDGRYGKVSIYRGITDLKLYLYKEKWCSTSQQSIDFRAVLNTLAKRERPYLENIVYMGEETQSNFCSEFSKFFAVWEFRGWNIKRKIKKWKAKKSRDGKKRYVSSFPRFTYILSYLKYVDPSRFESCNMALMSINCLLKPRINFSLLEIFPKTEISKFMKFLIFHSKSA